MKLKDANLQIGGRFKYPEWEGIWVVDSIVERGIIATHFGCKGIKETEPFWYWIIIPGSHKHLVEWDEEIEMIT